MTKFFNTLVLVLVLSLLPLLALCAEKEAYVVYFGVHGGEKAVHEIEKTHHNYLMSVKKSVDEARSSLVYSYKHINAFAAMLTPQEASKLSGLGEVVSVIRSRPEAYSLHTTRSWRFAGVVKPPSTHEANPTPDLATLAQSGKDVIVGVIDSGVWPDSKSFNDEGMEPVPESWKGSCINNTGKPFEDFNCTRKIIGARCFHAGRDQKYGSPDYAISPRDRSGHGTHTASIIAGRRVANVSALGGLAAGTASGGAPLARLAIYKACWNVPYLGPENEPCQEVDILAAIDQAIADGVHILALPLGTNTVPVPYNEDIVAIGALHAVKNDIVVVSSAGNEGPNPSTVTNIPPWVITVAASSVDRTFSAPVHLGNDVILEGKTLTPQGWLEDRFYPLVFARDVVQEGYNEEEAEKCEMESLSPEKVNGKIVLCIVYPGEFRLAKSVEVMRAGGLGTILGRVPNYGPVETESHIYPTTAVSSEDTTTLLYYINSTENPIAYIAPTTTLYAKKPAPYMAAFSGRGPNTIDPNILKPDITAPGINILAAWAPEIGPTRFSALDRKTVEYILMDGTSMSSSHVAGAAALLKSLHPTWSNAAIRSALITSATRTDVDYFPIVDEFGAPATPFAFGAGHFLPTNAADPGLVYDASYEDYLSYFCQAQKGQVNNASVTYLFIKPSEAVDLNYPSLQVTGIKDMAVIQRTVTNVGNSDSVYSFSAQPPQGYSIEASPNTLVFDEFGQSISFTITITPTGETQSTDNNNGYSFGWYTWDDGAHQVTSPVAVSA